LQETSPISNMQLVSILAGAHWGNFCSISCSHPLKWVCSSDLIRDWIFWFRALLFFNVR
jgi:hypothetical protein